MSQTVFVTVMVKLADPAEWTRAYGVEGAEAIKEDVKEHVIGNVRDVITGSGEIAADITGW